MKIITFTKTGLESHKKQLEELTSKRPSAVKVLSNARDMGDLSENGLYKAAKQELVDLDRQIRNLKYLIKYAKVLSPENNDFIQIGHKVLVEIKNEKKEFFLVGEYEANPKENKISNKSPIGFMLMGKKVGDKLQIKVPNGILSYKILSIEQS